MDRKILDDMSMEQLQEEAKKLDLNIVDDRNRIIDALMTYHERNSLVADLLPRSAPPRLDHTFTFATPINAAPPNKPSIREPSVASEILAMASAMTQPLTQLQQQMLQHQQLQQQTLQQLMATMAKQVVPNEPSVQENVIQSPGNRESSSHSVLATATSARAVLLLTSQIPEYGGGENKNLLFNRYGE
ncbi:hypothetical protein P5V15_015864 [Pogonomyrmex californicus]